MRTTQSITFAIALIAVFATAGCGGGSGSTGGGGSKSIAGNGVLYVSNQSRNSILRWNQASGVDGNQAPSAEIIGASTQLQSPRMLFLDPSADRLFVANFGSNAILMFDGISSANGNVAPTRVIAGSNTQLDGPVQVAVDNVRGLIYVSNSSANNILVFSLTISGNVAPAKIISSTFPFSSPAGIFYDSANDRLYVADSNNSAIQIFNYASTLIGQSKPARRIAGASTTINQPVDIAVSTSGLIVTDKGNNAVLTFANADTVDGDVSPQRAISGVNTLFVSPVQIQVITSTKLYIGSPGNSSIVVFDAFSGINGDAVPARRMVGDNTNLSGVSGGQGISGAAYDATRSGAGAGGRSY